MLVTMSVTMSVIIFKKRKIMNDIKLTSDKIGKKEVKKLRQKLLKDFLHTFPLDSLQGMTLEQYTNLNKDDSFCYWLESRTYELGSIWGGSSYKFGIYEYRIKTNIHNTKFISDEKYAWYARSLLSRLEIIGPEKARI